jgi:hypothetical protein
VLGVLIDSRAKTPELDEGNNGFADEYGADAVPPPPPG